MLAGLFVVLRLVSASLAPTAPKTNNLALLPGDLWTTIFGVLGIRDLELVNYVSKGFNILSTKVFLHHYGILHNDRIYPDFSKIAARLEALVQDADTVGELQEALKVLDSSREYADLKSILEANFGQCIVRTTGQLPSFYLNKCSLTVLRDSRKISLLPYVLDKQFDGSKEWIDLIAGLLKHGREDLLSRMCFPNVSLQGLGLLIAVGAPEAAIIRILGLPRARPFSPSETEKVAMAGCRDLMGKFESDRMLPLWVLWSSQRKGLSVPACRLFCDGLAEESIPFWKDLFQRNRRDMLEMVKEKAEESIRLLLSSFEEPNVIFRIKQEDRDVYQAILIYMNVSSMSNQNVKDNFDAMIQEGFFGVNSLRAAFDCKQYNLLATMGDNGMGLRPSGIVGFIEAVYQAGNVDLVPRIAQQTLVSSDLTVYVKSLVLLKANDDSYAQMLLGALAAIQSWYHPSHCFSAPLAVLRRLASGQEFSSADVEAMLREAKGYVCGRQVSRELHIVHTLMFWEASEVVLTYHIGRLAASEVIDGKVFLSVWFSSKYSDDFIRTSFKRCNLLPGNPGRNLWLFRNDLALELFGNGPIPLT